MATLFGYEIGRKKDKLEQQDKKVFATPENNDGALTEAFVYCWTDHKTNMLYIGSHKGTLDDGYICSSKYMKEEYTNRPNDFTRSILASGSWKDMYTFEGKLLSAFDAKNDPQFYNRNNNTKFIMNWTDDLREEYSKKFSGSGNPMFGKTMSDEAKEKQRQYALDNSSGEKNGMYGKNHSDETKQIIREKAINRLPSEETKEKMSKSHKKRWETTTFSEDVLKRFRENAIGNNYSGKKISTPFGNFDSMVAASRYSNGKYSEDQISRRVKNDKYPDWSLIE